MRGIRRNEGSDGSIRSDGGKVGVEGGSKASDRMSIRGDNERGVKEGRF